MQFLGLEYSYVQHCKLSIVSAYTKHMFKQLTASRVGISVMATKLWVDQLGSMLGICEADTEGCALHVTPHIRPPPRSISQLVIISIFRQSISL